MLARLFILFITILLIPILLLLAIIILLDDGYPFLFSQERVGINQSRFKIYKFRTMKKDMGDIPSHLLKNGNSYVIRSGYFLRKFSLDELPQLFNIIFGDMTLIGPRPALYNQDDLISLRKELGVNKLKPGITGWAQVNGRDELSIQEKVDLDYYYLKNRGLMMDVKIIFMTINKVLFAKNISL
jgi:O-antigen biosynthesis protein WbqP|tara:strand:- start:4265 stop:4816 length:552 start_codon:yes stop_codon:yes gene_type:complete